MKIDDITIGGRYWLRRYAGQMTTCYVIGKSESEVICQIHQGGIWAELPEKLMCEVIVFERPRKRWWQFWK